MKKIVAIIILFICFSSITAQENENIKNSIRVNGLALFSGYYEFQYERVITEKGAIKIGFGTGTLLNKKGEDADKDFETAFGTNSFNNENEHIVKGFSVNADYRYFFTKKLAPRGIYVSPGIQYLKLNEKYTYVNTNEGGFRTLVDNDYSIFNLRALFGYQFIIAKSIVINPYLGGGVSFCKVEAPTTRVDGYATGFSLNGGIDLGIGF